MRGLTIQKGWRYKGKWKEDEYVDKEWLPMVFFFFFLEL